MYFKVFMGKSWDIRAAPFFSIDVLFCLLSSFPNEGPAVPERSRAFVLTVIQISVDPGVHLFSILQKSAAPVVEAALDLSIYPAFRSISC